MLALHTRGHGLVHIIREVKEVVPEPQNSGGVFSRVEQARYDSVFIASEQLRSFAEGNQMSLRPFQSPN